MSAKKAAKKAAKKPQHLVRVPVLCILDHRLLYTGTGSYLMQN
jgi:hypothetical protein